MAEYNSDSWEDIKRKLDFARDDATTTNADSDVGEPLADIIERLSPPKRGRKSDSRTPEKRSEAAKKAAVTRKENAGIAEQVFKEIEEDERVNGPAFPPVSEAERERRCKNLLRAADRRPPLGKDGKPVTYGSSRMRLPQDKWKAYQRIRNSKESLFAFVCRMIDEEMIRQLEKELKSAMEAID